MKFAEWLVSDFIFFSGGRSWTGGEGKERGGSREEEEKEAKCCPAGALVRPGCIHVCMYVRSWSVGF